MGRESTFWAKTFKNFSKALKILIAWTEQALHMGRHSIMYGLGGETSSLTLKKGGLAVKLYNTDKYIFLQSLFPYLTEAFYKYQANKGKILILYKIPQTSCTDHVSGRKVLYILTQYKANVLEKLSHG